jgi:Ca2+-binding EF-hand superfamily protein
LEKLVSEQQNTVVLLKEGSVSGATNGHAAKSAHDANAGNGAFAGGAFGTALAVRGSGGADLPIPERPPPLPPPKDGQAAGPSEWREWFAECQQQMKTQHVELQRHLDDFLDRQKNSELEQHAKLRRLLELSEFQRSKKLEEELRRHFSEFWEQYNRDWETYNRYAAQPGMSAQPNMAVGASPEVSYSEVAEVEEFVKLNTKPCREREVKSEEQRRPSITELNTSSSMTRSLSFNKPHDPRLQNACLFDRVINSEYFECTFGLLILFNTFTMAVEAQHRGREIGQRLSYPRVGKPMEWANDFFSITEMVITLLFAMELVLRFAANRWHFFRFMWNWLDLFIVTMGLMDLLSMVELSMDPTMIRLLRLFKLTRLLRMAKLATFLDTFTLLTKSLAASWDTLFWSLLMLFGIKWTYSLLVFQLVQPYLEDPEGNPDDQRAVYEYYGTFTKTMITMFEITHVNYARAVRLLINKIGEGYAWVFIAYRVMISFAVLQVIRAVFIQQTLKISERDNELLIRNKDRSIRNYQSKLREIFVELTGSATGEVTLEQFQSVLDNEAIQTWLAALEIEARDAENLFSLLDVNNDGGVSADEFIKGASKLKGPARSIDLFILSERIEDLMERFEKQDQAKNQARGARQQGGQDQGGWRV